MEKEKRIYLSRSKKESLVRGFLKDCPAGTIFGRKEIMAFMMGLDVFKEQSESVRKARLEDLVKIMRESFGKEVSQVAKSIPGEETRWQKTSASPKEVEEEEKALKRKPASCGVKKLERLYNLLVYSVRSSKIGVSKEDAQSILEYISPIQGSGVDSLNDIYERESGFRPLKLNREHKFVDRDILSVDIDISELIIDEIKKKLGKEPVFSFEGKYEKEVKSVMRRDYRTLVLFFKTEDGTLKFHHGPCKAKEFRSLVCGSKTVAAEKVASKFKSILLKRYDINIDVVGLDRSYFRIDKEDARAALVKIEKLFAEYFCEKIVENLISEKEAIEASKLSDKEKILLGTIRGIVKEFSKKDRIFLSELWGHLQSIGLPGGDWLFKLLQKSNEYKISQEMNSDKRLEYAITRIVEEPKEPVIKEVVREVLVTPDPSPIREVIVGFGNQLDSMSDIRGSLVIEELQRYRSDYLYKIGVDTESKRSILKFLKLYYQSNTTDDITIICEDLENLVRDLESKIIK